MALTIKGRRERGRGRVAGSRLFVFFFRITIKLNVKGLFMIAFKLVEKYN